MIDSSSSFRCHFVTFPLTQDFKIRSYTVMIGISTKNCIRFFLFIYCITLESYLLPFSLIWLFMHRFCFWKCFYSFLRYLKFEMLMDTENRCKVTKAHWVRRVRWAKKKNLNIPTHVSFLIKVLSMSFIPMSALIHVRYF